jgi:hypothetical protein
LGTLYLCTGVLVAVSQRRAGRAERSVRVPNSRDPAEAAQTSLVRVQRELQLVTLRLVAQRAPPLRHPAATARPQEEVFMGRHQKNVAGRQKSHT